MPNSLERLAVAELIARAEQLGVDVPASLHAVMHGHCGSYAARAYADAAEQPDAPDVPDAMLGCCHGAAVGGLADCTCWAPEWNGEQLDPQPLTDPEQLEARSAQCSDCAFRRDSPERSEPWTAEALLALPERGEPFWCHEGMRRPVRWRHPAGPVVEGSPDDWQPPTVGAVPYRLDGRPGLLCHGWAVRAAKVDR